MPRTGAAAAACTRCTTRRPPRHPESSASCARTVTCKHSATGFAPSTPRSSRSSSAGRAHGRERRAAARYGVALVQLHELKHVAAGARLLAGPRAPAGGAASVADVFPAVGRVDRMLARRYDWLAGRLRLRPAGRLLALIILEWVALAALLAGSYLGVSMIAGRDGAPWFVAATAAGAARRSSSRPRAAATDRAGSRRCTRGAMKPSPPPASRSPCSARGIWTRASSRRSAGRSASSSP